MVKLDYQHVLSYINKNEIIEYENLVMQAANTLFNKTGLGNDFLGWVDYSQMFVEDEIKRIIKAAKEISDSSQILVIVGIGGSYLGAKAVLSLFSKYYPDKEGMEIIFAGNTLSSTHMSELLEYLEDKDFSINVISKSGTTTEPAVAFRLLRRLLIRKYSQGYHKRIYCTTTFGKGALYDLAIKNNYQVFSIPEDIGGRYSVITPVGLLAFAVKGINIREYLGGVKQAQNDCKDKTYLNNDGLLYAAIRNILYKKGKKIELLISYEPKFNYFGEWYKQLFGESEGKDNKGIFPSYALYTTDLHSLGQYVQDGERHLFETIIYPRKPQLDINIPIEDNDFDKLNYLGNTSLEPANLQAFRATLLAHVAGGAPNLVFTIPEITPYYIGYLQYLFMFACGISGYLLGVNPFNQEGVEDYKNNMFALLGKPGYEELKKKLEQL